ncbi:MAG TPA: type II secretion system protein GspG [Gemmataceae bacterium]|nr:type II secretion system protein GspG [Gemmataceae bacterium]
MRTFLCAAMTLLVVGIAQADEKNVETIVEDWVKAQENLVDVLKSIQDQPTAQAALPKLTELDRILRERREAVKKSGPDVEMDMPEKLGKRLENAKRQWHEEYKRLNGVNEAYLVLKDNSLIKAMQQDAERRAKTGVNDLQIGVLQFKLKYLKYPDELDELVSPPNGRAYVSVESLFDPFGRKYQYDMKGPKNGGLKPDIWSLGPRHLKDAIIGNWVEKK